MQSASTEDGAAAPQPLPQPAGETYRDHVIVVLPWMRERDHWQCAGIIVCCYEDGGRWPFTLDGPYPDRKTAYADAVARARRRIDRWFAEAGL